MVNDSRRDRLLGCFLGLAVGDSVGMPLEFRRRDTYEHLTDMVAGGPFDLARGQWTDDTSMAICLAESILARGEIDAADLRARWLRWMQHGENSSTGSCFDVGTGTRRALLTGKPGGEGNGSLMRLAPVVLRWPLDPQACIWAAAQSDVTHDGAARTCVYELARDLVCYVHGGVLHQHDLRMTYNLQRRPRHKVRSTGYCVDTLDAARWCVHHTTDFRSAVLLAANLGDDADTVAAVTGQLAGAKYGMSNIPEDWLCWLHDGQRLLALGEKLIEAGEAD